MTFNEEFLMSKSSFYYGHWQIEKWMKCESKISMHYLFCRSLAYQQSIGAAEQIDHVRQLREKYGW